MCGGGGRVCVQVKDGGFFIAGWSHKKWGKMIRDIHWRVKHM